MTGASDTQRNLYGAIGLALALVVIVGFAAMLELRGDNANDEVDHDAIATSSAAPVVSTIEQAETTVAVSVEGGSTSSTEESPDVPADLDTSTWWILEVGDEPFADLDFGMQFIEVHTDFFTALISSNDGWPPACQGIAFVPRVDDSPPNPGFRFDACPTSLSDFFSNDEMTVTIDENDCMTLARGGTSLRAIRASSTSISFPIDDRTADAIKVETVDLSKCRTVPFN